MSKNGEKKGEKKDIPAQKKRRRNGPRERRRGKSVDNALANRAVFHALIFLSSFLFLL
jgi:hypothetical protein